MLRLRRNNYVEKMLNSSREVWDKRIPSLSLEQIEWRIENSNTVLGIFGLSGTLFKRIVRPILLKRDDGGYVLFTPASKKDKEMPHFLYDILDIEEFVKRYPIQPVYTDDMIKELDIELDLINLIEDLDSIKNKPTYGFIETREKEETQVFNIG